ncbi:MAG: site-specific integrase [Lachnospiraceae bacterium]|jgi:integrase|nr:site-specific integrase [Lachnospiraceae bacterium]
MYINGQKSLIKEAQVNKAQKDFLNLYCNTATRKEYHANQTMETLHTVLEMGKHNDRGLIDASEQEREKGNVEQGQCERYEEKRVEESGITEGTMGNLMGESESSNEGNTEEKQLSECIMETESKSDMECKIYAILRSVLAEYQEYLILKEYQQTSIKKYLRDLDLFLQFVKEKATLNKMVTIAYKAFLSTKYKMSTINSYLISMNKFLGWLKCEDLRVKTERVQRKVSLERVISKEEYHRLLQYCMEQNRERDYLLIKTLAQTGIRIGELRYITVEAVLRGAAQVTMKRKTRTIFISYHLSEQLQNYCNQNELRSGIIFHGTDPLKALDASGVWKMMKRLARHAQIPTEVMYPHSFRHYFAKCFMEKFGNITELADLLGHSSIETTRIYTLTSSSEKREQLNLLDD